MKFVVFLFCLWFQSSLSELNTYRAASGIRSHDLDRMVQQLNKIKADIVVLPTSDYSHLEHAPKTYDEALKLISEVARRSKAYVVASLLETAPGQERDVLVRSNLVCDRDGAIVSIYKKSLNGNSSCNTSIAEEMSFQTDFGVRFGVLMEEDLLLQNFNGLDMKNYVVTGSNMDTPFLTAAQLFTSWSYTMNANLVSAYGIFAGREGLRAGGEGILVADLTKKGTENTRVPMTSSLDSFHKDWSQYIIRPLNLDASTRGYTDKVCHGEFCCEFKVKTKITGESGYDVSYGLAAFNGVRYFSHGNYEYIHTQTCAMFACAGLYKRSCNVRSGNNTNIEFEKITISGNYTKDNSAFYPIIVANSIPIDINEFNIDERDYEITKNIKIQVRNVENLLNFGILGRDFSKDFVSDDVVDKVDLTGVFDVTKDGNDHDLVDYVWIRLRVVIVVVSIYILEMM